MSAYKIAMLDESSTECAITHVLAAPEVARLHLRTRILVLAANGIPLLHAIIIGAAFLLPVNWIARAGMAMALLYLAPPLLSRTIRVVSQVQEGRTEFGGRNFVRWWCLLQLQGIFNRFPAFEEFLRIVPGLYSLWLRLWGAKIGRLTYWAPGTAILDRSFIEIGDDVVFGAGVRLNPHVLARNEAGKNELLLATIKIGAGAIIGGYSLLTAGTEIPAGESTRAHLLSPPFTLWKNGKRINKQTRETNNRPA